MLFEERSDSFIYYPSGESVTCKEINHIAQKLTWIYLKLRTDSSKSRPFCFSASSKYTSKWIAACWVSGIPFFVIPQNPSREIISLIQDYINPIAQFSDLGDDYCLSDASCERIYCHQIQESPLARLMSSSLDDICGYMMTSGTSGTPKIAIIKRKNIIQAALSAGENVQPGISNRWLLMLPLNHIGGQSVILRSIIYGNSISDFRFEKLNRIADELVLNWEVTMTSMVPTQLHKLLEVPDFKTHDEFKAILLGGGPSSTEMILEARKRKIPIMKSYGMTETTAQFTCVPINSIFNADPLSSGVPLPGNKIQIRDSNKIVLEHGESGLIYLKGPQVIDEYLYPKEANHAFDEKGWFYTGDYGHIDAKGNLYVEMRRSDLIITGGENVSPVKVENALLKLPKVKDVAVIGVEDSVWGQKLVALVVVDDKHFAPDVWTDALKADLSNFEVPREFKQIDTLPKNDLGKLIRSKLIELAV